MEFSKITNCDLKEYRITNAIVQVETDSSNSELYEKIVQLKLSAYNGAVPVKIKKTNDIY